MLLSEKKERRYSLDVVRCLFMFGVVLQHTFALCQGVAPVSYASIIVADCLTHPSVDGFASLSGWFGVKCTIRRLVRLSALIFFCGTLHYAIYQAGHMCCAGIYQQYFGFLIPDMSQWGFGWYRYWYLGAYLKLLVLSLLLNPILMAIGKLSRIWIVVIGGAFIGLSYLSLLWFHWEGHSPRTIIFIYIVVRFAMMLDAAAFVRRGWKERSFVGVLALALMALIVVNIKFHIGLGLSKYHNLMTILTGFSWVWFFSSFDWSVQNRFVRFCGWLAPSMISVYMLHWNCMTTFFRPLPQVLRQHIPCVGMIGSFLVTAAFVFLFCSFVDILRRKFVCHVYGILPQSKWYTKYI